MARGLVSRRLARSMVRTFGAILGDLGRAPTPGLVVRAAEEAAEQLRKLSPKAKHKDLARIFVDTFAKASGIRVTFPIEVKAEVVR